MKKTILTLIVMLALGFGMSNNALAKDAFLVHAKTDLTKDDAQICVAYNVILAAIKQGHDVSVLIDASAVNTFK